MVCCLHVADAQGRRPAVSRADLQATLKAEKGFVLTVSPAATPSATDEAYADWASYLNIFATTTGAKTKILKLSSSRYKGKIAGPRLSHPFATLFVLDERHILIYDGTVLEPAIYELGLAYISHRPFDQEAAASYGLKQSSFSLR